MFKNLSIFLLCILGLYSSIGYSQTNIIEGKVKDVTGVPLPGVNIVLKGTTTGALSDFDGKYSIGAPGDGTLVFSMMGFATKEIDVNGRSTVNVVLQEDVESLEEVVVTALGIKKSTKALGYSLTEVGGEEVSAIKQTNAINSLQGKVAGVNITQNATGAAGSSRVVIRGSSSLTQENQPLYVVDGIPISNDNNGSAGEWGGTDGGDGISSINPDDIASISVLKGGAASALYGSRAANGVIILTTKKGKEQKGLGVTLSSAVTFDRVDTSLQDLQTTYGQGRRGEKPGNQEEALEIGFSSWGSRLDGTAVPQWDGVARPYSYIGNNLDHFYRTGTTFINTVALANASETLNYRFSASDLSNEDVMPNAGLNRKTFSLNVGSVMAKKLTTNVNVKYIRESVTNRPRLSDAPGNANYTLMNLSPNVDVRLMNPGVNSDLTERQITQNVYTQNPYFSAYHFRNEDVKNRIIASSSIRYDITDWLYTLARVGVDHYTIKKTEVEPWGTAYKPLGGMTEREIRYSQIDSDLMLGVDKTFGEKINLVSFAGINSNQIEREDLSLSGNDFIVPGLEDIGNTNNQSRNRTYNKRKIGSVYGSVELSYDNLAFLTFTGRNDWFSTLSFPGKTTPNNDFYSSVSGSVILSDLFPLPETVNFLKLRGGYSQVAGGASDAYQLALTYEIFGQGHLGQPLGKITNGTVPNFGLVPFSKTETEVGLDARLFNNRLSFDVAYYKNNTTNDIVFVSTSVFSGYDRAIANIGEIENKGIEFLVSGTPVKTNNFLWKTAVNGAHNKGIVLATNEVDGEISLGQPRSQNVEIKQVVGQPQGVIVGVSYERDEQGAIIYDIDSDGVPLAREGERKILGEGVPPLTLGWSNTINYKDFSLSFLIDGKFGGQIFSGTNTVTYTNGLHKATLEGRENGLSVSGIDGATGAPFTRTVSPEFLGRYYSRVGRIAEQFVEDADFIKFRQVSLSYSLPNRYLEKTFINKVNVSFIASNLFYLMRNVDNIDPEAAYNVGNAQGLEYFGVPSTRSYGMSLQVTF
ncbi:SusC/RagA family TonB-linked outer membrane protein [Aquimarina sp. TRL1]|uniref:SusC/RagA family TonB-linked outer membrane protein n=1 Tax=Aquimarina sp. (strain TRL1) TaxID=2736252 RepID=UPI001589FEC9|nr:SusC/RagA family TonB-linked outer membrane protein [Aquimarina sp. TRL1]QKX06666.1 SusC/RagA family TonB-linked outer membrane protein [Aquimarina sp. TRL1]